MKIYFRILAAFVTLAVLASPTRAADHGFVSLFNGKDLTGWEGDLSFWSVKDGAITGQTTKEHPLEQNTFLVCKAGDVANFELRASFRLVANNTEGFANSGVQYRSKIVDRAKWVLGGYQADMDFAGKYIGMLYEERGRGIVMEPGQRVLIRAGLNREGKAVVDVAGQPTSRENVAAAYRPGEWNDIVIIAEGSHLRHRINGVVTADVVDEDQTRGAKSGVLGLQLHRGQPMMIQFKDIQIRVLP